MKKICFFSANFENSGGTERVTSIIANELVKLGYDITIISCIGGRKSFFKLDERIKLDNLYDSFILSSSLKTFSPSYTTNYCYIIPKFYQFISYYRSYSLCSSTIFKICTKKTYLFHNFSSLVYFHTILYKIFKFFCILCHIISVTLFKTVIVFFLSYSLYFYLLYQPILLEICQDL